MSCTRSNSAFANKIKKRLREKINTDLPAAYPRAFTWAVYGQDGSLVVRRSQDDPKASDLPEGSPVSAANLGTALTRLLEAAVGFANTVTSGSDSPADIVHVAGSKFLFTAARFGSGFVLAFFSHLTAVESTPSESKATTTTPVQTPVSSGKAEEEKPAAASSESNTSIKSSVKIINDEDIAQSTFAGDQPLRQLLSDLNLILTEVHVSSGSSSAPARRTSVDEAASGASAAAQTTTGSTSTSAATSSDTRTRYKAQGH